MRAWRPIFLVCMRDVPSNKFCVPEVQETANMPQSTADEIAAKFSRLCSTRCFHRVTVAAVLWAMRDFSNATQKRAAMDVLERIDSVCMANEGGEYCMPKWAALADKIQAGKDSHGCVYPSARHSRPIVPGLVCAAHSDPNRR